MDPTRHFWLIAGPDGVGKTTYAFRNIAARIALSRARDFIRRGEVFSMETTMAGRTHLKLLQEARAGGVATTLLCFPVRHPDICLERVARRVAEGGHDVDVSVVRRRFARSHANLPDYCAAADLWRVYEASGSRPCLAVEGRRDRLTYADPDCLAAADARVAAFAKGATGAR